MLRSILYATSMQLLLLSWSCSNPASLPLEKDPRSWSWTVDTIRHPRGFPLDLQGIWGSSPSNVYAVGFSSDGVGVMHRYDGSIWKSIPIGHNEGGPVYGVSELRSVYGFSPNQIYAVGTRGTLKYTNLGLIVRFDGSTWQEENIDSCGSLRVIWGTTQEDVWAGGMHCLMRRQSGRWQKVAFPARTAQVQFSRIIGSSASDVYFIGYSNGVLGADPYGGRIDLYHYDGNTLGIIDSFFVGPGRSEAHFGQEIALVGGVLYSGELGVFKRSGTGWTRISTPPKRVLDIVGSSESNIFFVGADGMVAHYNGVDTYQCTNLLQSIWLNSAWFYGSGLMALGSDNNLLSKGYVLHGR